MKNIFSIIKIVFAVVFGIIIGSFITSLFGLDNPWAGFAINTGIIIAFMIIIQVITSLLTTGKRKIVPMDEMKNLHKVKKSEISKASLVLADAFQEDPLFKKITERYPNKSEKFRLTAEMMLRYCHKYGDIYASSGKFEGIMALTQEYMTIWHMIRSGAIIPFLKLGFKSIMIVGSAFDPIDEIRKKNVKNRSHIYVQIIGVSSKYQGQGYGGKLIKSLIKESAQLNLPIYLDTETESNVSLYERFGFKTLEQINLPVIDQPMWAMIREIKDDD